MKRHRDGFRREVFWVVAFAAVLIAGFVAVAQAVIQPLPVEKPALLAPGRLEEGEAARYARIFTYQDAGNWKAADAEVAKLSDRRLMGHVLFQRYMHPAAYRASYDELAAWLKNYSDHPGAMQVYHLALKRKPAKAAAPQKPEAVSRLNSAWELDGGHMQLAGTGALRQKAIVQNLARTVRGHLSQRAPSQAYKSLSSDQNRKLLNPAEYNSLKAEIAATYFYLGKTDKAFSLASEAASRTESEKADIPLAGWIAGLSAWKLGQHAEAARYFEAVASSDSASPWTRSAGAYWAARAHKQMKEKGLAKKWLARAAEHPRTFYGLIASRALGQKPDLNWALPPLKDKHIKVVSNSPAGYRALALLDAGRPDMAESELKRLPPGDDLVLKEALVSLADKAGMPGLALRIGSALKDKDGELYDVALYPLAPWRPQGGYDVDVALVNAFIRQESRFEPDVQSHAGARGLMQLMPATASHVAGGKGRFASGEGRAELMDPVLNIELGQRYLADLMGNGQISGNLFKLAIAYNAGPGKLSRWLKDIDYQDDPLLFIESIPVSETRAFVERVLANYWIYRMRLKQAAPSLDDVAEGQWPRYEQQDGPELRFAENADDGWQRP